MNVSMTYGKFWEEIIILCRNKEPYTVILVALIIAPTPQKTCEAQLSPPCHMW